MNLGTPAGEDSVAISATRIAVLSAKPALVAGFLALPLYLATPTACYYWDGLAFASHIERIAQHTDNANSLFHQNHLIYNAICYLLYSAAGWLGWSIRALTMMQMLSAVSCSIGAGIFFSMVARITRSFYIATVASGLLVVSSCWWKAATDADAYSVSVVLVLVCASELLRERPRWYVGGLALAGAMLIHELASLFYPAALVAVLLSKGIEGRTKFAIKLSGLGWGVTIASYYVVAAIVFGITKPSDVIKWAASNPYGFTVLDPVWAIRTLPQHTIDLIFGHSFKVFRQVGGGVERGLAIVGMVTACIAIYLIARRGSVREFLRSLWEVTGNRSEEWKGIMPGLLVWIGTYVVLLLFWPYTPHYHVYYVPALVLIFALALSRYHRGTVRPPTGGAAVAVVALLFLNLAFFIAPHMRVNSNPLLAAANDAKAKWNEHTVIYFTDWPPVDGVFRYFNEKTEWRRASPKAIKRLDPEIKEIYDHGGQVWLSDSAVKSVEPEWLARRTGDQFTVTLDGESYRYVQLLPRVVELQQ